jgi:hypothetical protein
MGTGASLDVYRLLRTVIVRLTEALDYLRTILAHKFFIFRDYLRESTNVGMRHVVCY